MPVFTTDDTQKLESHTALRMNRVCRLILRGFRLRPLALHRAQQSDPPSALCGGAGIRSEGVPEPPPPDTPTIPGPAFVPVPRHPQKWSRKSARTSGREV